MYKGDVAFQKSNFEPNRLSNRKIISSSLKISRSRCQRGLVVFGIISAQLRIEAFTAGDRQTLARDRLPILLRRFQSSMEFLIE